MTMFRLLKKDVDLLEVSRDDLNAAVEKAAKDDNHRKLAMWSAVIGAVTGAALIALNYLRLILTAGD